MRLSVSDLDQYLYWREDEGDDERGPMSVETLLRRLRREEPPSEEMLAGTALHKALEKISVGDFPALHQDGYTFEFDCEASISIPQTRELKLTKTLTVDGVPITLVGKVDAMPGIEVWDYKTTARFDPEKFLNGYQWRFYLMLTGLPVFRWIVFQMAFRERRQSYVINSVHELKQYTYTGLMDDCTDVLRDFVHFCRMHWPEKLAT